MASSNENIIAIDMDEHSSAMKNEAMKIAKATLDAVMKEASKEKSSKKNEKKDRDSRDVKVSKEIKKEFDKKYGPTWHCIVGTDFKAHVTYEAKHYICFKAGKHTILLYKAG